MKDSNYWKIKPIRLHFNLDSDRDGVPDWKDCQPFNPFKQDRIIICPMCGEERSYFAKGLCKNCYHKEYHQRPKVIEHQKEYHKEYHQRPKVIEHQKEYHKEYHQRPKVIEHRYQTRQKPTRQMGKRPEEMEAMYLLRRKIRNLLILDREEGIKLIEKMKKEEGEEFTNLVLEYETY